MKRSRAKRARHASWIAFRTQGMPALEHAWAERGECMDCERFYGPREYALIWCASCRQAHRSCPHCRVPLEFPSIAWAWAHMDPAPGPAHDPEDAVKEADRVF